MKHLLRGEIRRQFKAVRRLSPAAARADVKSLHDWRVAVRRLRTLLRVLPHGGKDGLPRASAMQAEWRGWARRCGPARDADVWARTMKELGLRRILARTPQGRALLTAGERRRRSLHASLRRRLTSAAYRTLLDRTHALVQEDVAAWLRKQPDRVVQRLVSCAFQRLTRKAQRRMAGLSTAPTPSHAHAIRRAIRRARYLADTGHRILPKTAARLKRPLVRLQAALGDAHDADVQMRLLKGLPRETAAPVRQLLRKERAKAIERFRRDFKSIG